MAKQEIEISSVDQTFLVFIPDPASTVGKGKTGLVAANLTVSYTRVETDNDVIVTDVTGSLNDLTALTDAHNDWGLKEVSATLAPGLYRLDAADAVFASGAVTATIYVCITSGLAAASPMEFVLGITASSIAAIKAITDNLTSQASLTAAIMGATIEGSITAGAGLTNDTGTQLTAITLKQAVALILAALDGVLSGAAGTTVTIKQAGKPAGNSRIVATVDADGNRSALTLKVPD